MNTQNKRTQRCRGQTGGRWTGGCGGWAKADTRLIWVTTPRVTDMSNSCFVPQKPISYCTSIIAKQQIILKNVPCVCVSAAGLHTTFSAYGCEPGRHRAAGLSLCHEKHRQISVTTKRDGACHETHCRDGSTEHSETANLQPVRSRVSQKRTPSLSSDWLETLV